METILTVLHLFLAIGLVGLVLIQHGKGADAGAAFGSGASATVFGSQGSANFLSRATAIFAALFFATSLWLAYYSMQGTEATSLMDAVPEAVDVKVPPVAEPEVVNSDSDLPAVPDLQPVTVNDSDLPVVNNDAVPAVVEPVTMPEPALPAVEQDVVPAVVEPVEAGASAVEETMPEKAAENTDKQ